MLTFVLAVAALALVMTALTHAELRQPAGAKLKWSETPVGLRVFICVLVTSMVGLLLAGLLSWASDVLN